MKSFKNRGVTPTPIRRVQKTECEALPLRSVSGFTLIELLIVIAIVGVLVVAGMTNYFGTRNRIIFESQVVKIAADLQATRERSRVQEGGDQWGIHFENPAGAGNDFYDIWHGVSYAAGTTTSRSVFSSSVEFTAPGPGSTLDVVFAKATGLPTASFTIDIQSTQSSATATIKINTQGRVDYTLN